MDMPEHAKQVKLEGSLLPPLKLTNVQ